MDIMEKMTDIPQRMIIDSVFKDLFSFPQYTLELYQALHPEDTSVTTSDIKNVTITSVILDAQYNDLSMLVKDKLLILIETQSIADTNIALRVMKPLSQFWCQYIKDTNEDIDSPKPFNLPVPEFYALYMGNCKDHPSQVNFSDAAINLTANVLYGTDPTNILGQYVAFTKVCDEQVAMYGRTLKAIRETIAICKDKNFLADYLAKRENEVITIMESLFSQEEAVRQYGNALKHEGMQEEQHRVALNMNAKGMGIADISDILDVPADTIQDLLAAKATS